MGRCHPIAFPIGGLAGEMEPVTCQTPVHPGVSAIPISRRDESPRCTRAPERGLPRYRTPGCRSIVPMSVRPCHALALQSLANVGGAWDRFLVGHGPVFHERFPGLHSPVADPTMLPNVEGQRLEGLPLQVPVSEDVPVRDRRQGLGERPEQDSASRLASASVHLQQPGWRHSLRIISIR